MAEQFDSVVEQCYTDLEQKIRDAGMNNINLERVRSAFEVAARAHDGQKRRDGSPYVTHCSAAAGIIVDMGMDEDSIVSALLHDTMEDTGLTHEDIARQFGADVADIVEGVTKLTRVNYTSREEEQMENMRKMLMAMSKDIRVILIKLADRLHNMLTMDYQMPEKQRLKSLETMEIYAPIAHRLGIQTVKWELEDLSLKYLDPVAFQTISDTIETQRPALEAFMDRMEEKIRTRLDEWNIQCTIYHRIKHTYSIYRKMYTQRLELSEILDICALRVIVDNVSDCYNVLGQVHDMFNPVPGKFKDYISTPKPNGYQSLQTTLLGAGKDTLPFEVQIRTWDMHRTAEYGIAAHWKYKSGQAGVKEGDEEKFAWVRRLLETQQDSDAEDFLSGLKVDMFADEVFVFTPKGDVVSLPAGATPVDFAYSIHSAVGNSMVSAKVNGRIVPFGQELQNGDIVEVLTSKSASGPNRDWLKLAKSGSARTKIKQWLKKERREECISLGRDMLDAEFKRAGITMNEINDAELVPVMLKKLSMSTMDDIYAVIGYGGLTAMKVANRFRDELLRVQKAATPRTALDKMNAAAERRNSRDQNAQHPIHGVLIAGLDNCLLKFARCCTPVAGDDIVGFITRGYGVSIHRTDCKNYQTGRQNPDGEGRWVDASWAHGSEGSYVTSLVLRSVDRNALVMDIALVLTSMNAKVRSLSARGVGNGLALTNLSLEVKNRNELKAIMAQLSKIPGMKEVCRANG